MNEPTPVDRCYCAGVTFAQLLDMSQREHLDIEALGAKTGCARGCGLCRHYVEVVLATGRTRLPVMTRERAEEIVRSR